VKANQAVYPVATMCRVLGVSRSGFYDWVKREPSTRSEANAVLLQVIREVHHESDGTYGAPRVHAELDERGPPASLNRVARVMREAGVQGVSPRKGTRTTLRSCVFRRSRPLVPEHADHLVRACRPHRAELVTGRR
jgi:putative transposase